MGYSYTIGGYVANVSGHSNAFTQEHLHNYFNIGPSIYCFPLNTVHHRIHIGAGVNYSHSNDAELMNSYEPTDNSEYKYFQRPVENGVGFTASAGYTYKITKNIGIGARCCYYLFNESHVSALLNICIEF